MEKVLVKTIMSGKVTVAGVQHTFSQVLEFFNSFNMHHIPVMKDEKIIGIISDSDVMRVLSEKLLKGDAIKLDELNESIKIEQLMTASPVTISEDATIDQALQLFFVDKFRALPVVDKAGALAGIITSTDLLHTFFKEMRPPSHFEINSPGAGV